jgi:hypothetical protein
MFKNITDWKTTIPTLVGAIFTILGLFSVVTPEELPVLSNAFTAIGLSVLTIVGVFAKAK